MDTGVDIKAEQDSSNAADVAELRRLVENLVSLSAPSTQPIPTLPSAASTQAGSRLNVQDEIFTRTEDTPQPKAHMGRWVGGVVTVLISLIGSIYAWSGSLVTHDALEGEISPIEQKLESHGEQLNAVQLGVDKLLKRTERQDKINEARRLVEKHARSYQAQLEEYAAASNKRNRQKPRKSAALLAAEAKLETLLEAQ